MDGISYKGSLQTQGRPSSVKQEITISYNPTNPEEYFIDTSQNWQQIIGISMMAIAIGIFVAIRLVIRKAEAKNSGTPDNSHPSNS